MFNSLLFRFLPDLRRPFVLVALAVSFVACNDDSVADPRFDDPALRRPNDSRKLTVVFVDGVPVPVESARMPRPMDRPHEGMPMPSEAEDPPRVVWKVPTAWKSVKPSSRMRLAEYEVPASEGAQPAEVAVFYFGPRASPVEETISMWLSSFDEASAKGAKRSERGETSLVEVSGTYQAGGMGGGQPEEPRAGWKLIGAVVQTSMGPYYIKLLGPSATVDAGRDGLMEMIDSVHVAAPEATSAASAAGSGSASPPAPSASSTP